MDNEEKINKIHRDASIVDWAIELIVACKNEDSDRMREAMDQINLFYGDPPK